MINKNCFKISKTGFVLGALILGGLTQYVDNAGAQSVVIAVNPPVAVAPAIVIPDDYVYYPNYGVYYNTRRHQYNYMRNGQWVVQGAPEGVSANVLLASPSVKMDFHDSPANHHAEMVKRYPKNWTHGSDHGK
jgi:hypothetical protein